MARKTSKGLTQRADGYYVKTINIKKVLPNGSTKTVRKSFYDKDPKKVWQKYAEYLQADKDSHLFRNVADAYDTYHLQTLAEGSLRSLLPALRSAVDYFGDIPIEQISSADVQLYLKRLQGRAMRTVKNYKSVLSQIFDYAIINMRINIVNPVTAVALPRNLPKGERTAVTDAQIAEIKKTGADEFLLPILILYTGCRCGEACALQWSDIDFKNDTIHISKSVHWQGNKPYIGRLKTKNADRIVPLLAPLKLLLKQQKTRSATFFVVSGVSMLSASQLTVQWTIYCKNHNMAHTYRKRDGDYTHQAWKADIDRHQLRHAYATILWESGIDVKTAQHLLGHANFATTMDIYTHWKDSALDNARIKLNEHIKTE